MASPQKENGYTAIANEILEQIVKLRIPPSEKDLMLCVIRKTYGYQKKEDRISLTQFEKATGLSRVTVVKSLKNLLTRKILVKRGILFSFNKDWENWVVKSGILVKSENIFGIVGYTKTGKVGYTHKRKKEITKETMEKQSFSKEGSLLVESFIKINPACKKMYGNTTQRRACDDLIETYGLDRVLKVINDTLPRTNKMTAQFFPNIGTPLQLFDKWQKLEDAIFSYREKNKIKNNNVFW